jgi:hypothetical protein
MKTFCYSCALGWLFAFTLNVSAAEGPALESHLEPVRPLLDKTWRGPFKNSKPDKPVVDVMRWERALNGKAIRVLHSVNEGSYGGETIYMWDEKKQAVGFHYFTTAGFMTVGSVDFKENKLITHEVVAGRAGGVTEVRATSELLADGGFRVTTEHLKDGKWEAGREVIYREDTSAKVTFR